MKQPAFLANIHGQPGSHRRVIERQTGEGKAAFEETARLLGSGQRVVLTGMGSSQFAAVSLEYMLVGARAVETAELLHYQRALCDGAVVVVISRSGESVEAIKLLEAVKARAAAVVGVTNVAESPLAREADVALVIGHDRDEMIAIQNYTGSVLALQMLGARVLGKLAELRDEAFRIIDFLPGVIGEFEERSHQWGGFLSSGGPIHLLARGPSVGSAMEAGLLINETAKEPSVQQPAGSFRHGPAEQVEPGWRGLMFAPAGRTQGLNLALARSLAGFGGAVKVIGPAGAEGAEWWGIPETSEWLAPLVESVPAQFLALRMAQSKGIEVGRFRHGGQVTRDEAEFVRAPS